MSDEPLYNLSKEELIDIIWGYRELYYDLLLDFHDIYDSKYGSN